MFSSLSPNITSEFIQAYDFEVFNIEATCKILIQYRPLMITIVSLYLFSVFLSQRLMQNVKPFELRTALFTWNVLLAIMSIVGFVRTFPEPLFILGQTNGIYLTICTYELHNYATGFWALVSTLSKLVELGDTAFIVLRKQKLIFLHWYHHTTVILLTWLGYETYDPVFRYFVPMNFFIHAWMYSYYALKSQRIPVPKFIAVGITTTQIFQMIIGSALSVYSLILHYGDSPCVRPLSNIILGLAIFGSYFVLFVNYFFNSYFLPRKSTKTN